MVTHLNPLLVCLAVMVSTVTAGAQTVSPATLNVSALLNKGLPTSTPAERYRQHVAAAAALLTKPYVSQNEWPALIAEARQELAYAAQVGVPSTEWYLLSASTFVAEADAGGYATTIGEGHTAYPYSTRLGFAHGKLMLEDTTTSATAFASLTLSPAAQTQLRSWLAFRQNHWVDGLLELERAYYLDRDEPLPSELRSAATTAFNLLAFSPDRLPKTDSAQAFQIAYAQSLRRAAGLLREVPLDTTDRYVRTHQQYNPATQFPKLRVVALRDFADRGLLGTYNDPLLVDLYVLDRAGHLEAATQGFTEAFLPGAAESRAPKSPERLAAEKYMRERWARDVQEALAGVGE